MKKNRLNLTLTAGCRFFVLILLLLCFETPIYALSIGSVDSEGNLVDIDKDLKEQSDFYFKDMEAYFRNGDLASVRYIGEKLLKVKHDDGNIKALLSLCYAAGKDLKKADEWLAAASKGKKASSLYQSAAQAMIYKAKGMTPEALSACKKALSSDSKNSYLFNMLGRIYLDMNKTADALSAFNTSVALNSSFIPGRINLGVAHYFTKNYPQAVLHFTEAVRLSPSSFNAQYGLAAALEATGNEQGALHHYRESLKINPESKDALTQTALIELNLMLYQNALNTAKKMELLKINGAQPLIAEAALHLGDIKTATKYIGLLPDSDLTKTYLQGYLHFIEGRYDQAKKSMEQALKQKPNLFGAFLAVQTLKFYQNNPQRIPVNQITSWGGEASKATAFVDGCMAASKGDWNSAYTRWKYANGLFGGFTLDGFSANDLKQYVKPDELKHLGMGIFFAYHNFSNQSLSEFDKAIGKNSASCFAHYFSGVVSLKIGNRDKAETSFKKASDKAPRFFSAVYTLGEMQAAQGRFDQALTYYIKAAAIKDDFGIIIKQGLIYERKNKFDEAEKKYTYAIKMSPENYIGYNQLAWLYAKQGKNLSKAMELAQKADKLLPGNASILDTMGWILYQNKDYMGALSRFETAIKGGENNPTILYHLGVVYHAQGKHADAKKYLKKALSISGNFEEAVQAKSLLNKIK